MNRLLKIQLFLLIGLYLIGCSNSVEEASKDGKNSPVIENSRTISVNENQVDVATIIVSDLDGTAKITTKISGGADSNLFVLLGNQLRFIEAPDFEYPTNSNANNEYEVEITASDGTGQKLRKLMLISVLNLNDNEPVLSSPSFYKVPENTIQAGEMIASDADNDVVEISLDNTDKCVSINDNLYFKIESNNLIFYSPPDYEYVQIDGNKKLSYSVQLLLDDGTHVICKEVLLEITDVLLAKPALTVNYYVKEWVLSWNEDLEATEFTLIRQVAGNINPEEVIAQLSPVELEYRLKIPVSL